MLESPVELVIIQTIKVLKTSKK